MLGVISTGEVERTVLPEPVDAVTPVPPLATGRVPVTPVVSGRPVALVSVANDGTPIFGVVSTGEVAKTKRPEPVSLVIAAARLAEDGVARNVATLVPRPETPVEIGRPVAFVSVANDGTPMLGVVSTGEERLGAVAKTSEPDPVSSVIAAARFALDGVPSHVATPVPSEVMPVPPLATGRAEPRESEAR
jgi:hypothetical protein